MSSGTTSARVLHWFVRGGLPVGPDGVEHPIDVDALLVGRDENAALRVVHPEVSALHCELRAVTEGILVKDLGSTKGTFVGTTRVREAVSTTKAEVRVGTSRIVVTPLSDQKVDVGFVDRFGPIAAEMNAGALPEPPFLPHRPGESRASAPS